MVYGTTSSAADVYQARIPTTPGEKKVYVGANLLPGQVHAICGQAEGKGLYTAAGAGYDEVIRQFARGTEGIAMTGKAGTSVTVSAGTDVNVDLTASPITLERVVAKVLLVCDTYTDDGGAYVRMSGNAARPSADPGWIRLSDVRYALNTVNRKVYLNAPPDGKDPNHEVDPYVVKDDGGNYVSAPDVAEQQFVYRTLGSVWAEGIAPEAYEEVKFNATKATPPESGAYTGEISPNMLVDAGVKYVIIGHSERREYFAETDETVNKKVLKAFEHDLTPIICCGETLTQRKQGIYVDWIRMQIKIAFQNVTADQAKKAVIAYEPIWAIGTGETATADQAEEVCAAIRACIGEIYDAATADAIRIQYGGSMNAKNAAELLAKPDIDGGLIGGASLKPAFGQIVNA